MIPKEARIFAYATGKPRASGDDPSDESLYMPFSG